MVPTLFGTKLNIAVTAGCRQVVKGQRQVEVSAILECGGLAPLWHAPTRSI